MITQKTTYRRISIREIYLGFCAFSVFRGLLKHPLFDHFLRFCRTNDLKSDHLQLDAYGAFVGEIYALGGDLAQAEHHIVCKALDLLGRGIGITEGL